MTSSPLVVIGASAGGVAALGTLLAGLPATFPSSVLVVLHVAADAPSLLPEILSRAGALPARHPRHGEPLLAGHVYVAPPDHHLLAQRAHVEVTRGPKENLFRPSVDALFRSAALSHGANVIGVVLTGMLDDGASGLWAIKQRGGVTIVQTPEDAPHPSMPLSALRHGDVDHVVPVRAMGALLARLVRHQTPGASSMNESEEQRLRVDVNIARGENALAQGVTKLGEPSLLTCPECHGALVQFEEGDLLRFRCHTGHAYTASTLLSEQTKTVEHKAYQLMRSLEESLMLMRRLSAQCEQRGDPHGARAYADKAREAEERIGRVRHLAQRSERLSETRVLGHGDD